MTNAAPRPCILLVPGFTELEWAIKSTLEQWAEVASYDPPGVGDEPLAAEIRENLDRPHAITGWREATAERGLVEVDAHDWSRFFVVADGFAAAPAVRLATMRPDAVLGIALGHAALSNDMDGERPTTSRAVWEAMGQLLHEDYAAFITHGIAQMTAGTTSEERAAEMVERFPLELAAPLWGRLAEEREPIGDDLRALAKPLLFAQHRGCLVRTEEGFADIVAAFPDAAVLVIDDDPARSDAFAASLQEFCAKVGQRV